MVASSLSPRNPGLIQDRVEEAQQTSTSAQARTILSQFSEAFEEAANKVSSSVVSIFAEQVVEQQSPFGLPDEALRDFFGDDFFRRFFDIPELKGEKRTVRSLGSGVIVSKDGYILTNNHVVENAQKLSVVIGDKKKYEAKIVGADSRTDVAVVKINAKDLPAATPPGSSVKIVLIRDGQTKEVTAVVGEQPGERPARPEKKQEQVNKKLGLSIQDLTPAIARQLGYQGDSGALVIDVDAGSPAEDAGLQRGDLIKEANRVEVKSVEDFNKAMSGLKSGDTAALYVRHGQAFFFTTIAIQ